MTQAGLRAALLSSMGIFGSALCWLLSFKILAYWLGPEGVGLFAQLRQFAQTATLGATFGGTNVVVQGLATRQDELARRRFRAEAARLFGIAGLGVVTLMLVAAPGLTQLILSSDTPELVEAVRWLALAVFLNIVSTYMLAVLNGYRSHGYLAIAQIAGPAVLVGFLAAAWLGFPMPSALALVAAFVLCFGVTGVVGIIGVFRLREPESDVGSAVRPEQDGGGFLRFASFNLLAALSSVVALLVIRSWIIEGKGLAFSGLFDAGWTLTFNYATLFLTACNTLYLPLLAGSTSIEQQKSCMLKAAYLVLGSSLSMGYAIVLCQEPLIHLLYSPEFDASREVLPILVVAMVFRGVSWTYGTMLLATRKSSVMLISEIALSLALLLATRYALDSEGTLASLGWAFVLPHFLYLVFVVEYARKENNRMWRRHIWPLLTAGILPLFCLAIMPNDGKWFEASVEAGWFAVAGVIATYFSYRAFRRVEH